MLEILDCTIRDGSYATNYQWDGDILRKIVSTLSQIGIKYIEIGNGVGLGTHRKIREALDDESYFSHTIPYKGNSLIGAFFIPGTGTKDDLKNFWQAGGRFIRIGSNATEIEKSLDYIEYAKHLGFMVCSNLMKTYAISKYQLAYKSRDLIKAGCDVIYVVDSAGCMLPSTVSDYFKSMREIYQVQLGFHGHNNLQLANANSLAAAEAGATFIDATLSGLGRGAGNAQLESIIAIFQKANLLENNITDVLQLSDFSNEIMSTIAAKEIVPTSKRNIAIGIANFHDSYAPLAEKYASLYNVDTELLIKEVSKINVVNPAEELFELTARKIAEGAKEIIFFPKFSHKNYTI